MKNMKRIAIISPSGKFYGSEQVLFDFLSTSYKKYDVFTPHGTIYEKIKVHGVHTPRLFSSVKRLYAHLAWQLLCGKYDGIYINEAGHIRYLNLLADVFPHKHFYAHIRLLEDCSAARLGQEKNNITYISVSNYITHEVERNTRIKCHTIHDIYKPSSGTMGINDLKDHNGTIRLGIVGRVTSTKGLNDISYFCDYCENNPSMSHLEFNFFGGIDDHIPAVRDFVVRAENYKHITCKFRGFISEKRNIYQDIDLLIHFNKVESLGRIIMEALDYGVPFIGFQSGGIGELANLFGVGDYMVPDADCWEHTFYKRIMDTMVDYDATIQDYTKAKEQMKIICSPDTYTRKLENLFYE